MSTRFAAKTVALGIVGALAIATATATPAGAAAPAADPGVSNNQIVIGTTGFSPEQREQVLAQGRREKQQ